MSAVVDEAVVGQLVRVFYDDTGSSADGIRAVLAELSKTHVVLPKAEYEAVVLALAGLRNMHALSTNTGMYGVGYNDALMDMLAILKEVPSLV